MAFDSKFMVVVKKQTKTIKVFLPKQCPFRVTAPYYDGEEDCCGYLKSLHETVEKRMTISGHTFSYRESASDFCVCTDEQWIEGCPLLNDSFQVVKS